MSAKEQTDKIYGCPRSVKTQGLRFGYHKCTKPIWKDGFCKIHHPDSEKSRDEKARQRYEAEWANNPLMKLKKSNERICQLETELTTLQNDVRMLVEAAQWAQMELGKHTRPSPLDTALSTLLANNPSLKPE